MTTEERLQKLEWELGATRRWSRWLLVGLVVGLGVWVFAGTLGREQQQARAMDFVPPCDPPRYRIAGVEGWNGPFVLDAYNGTIYLASPNTTGTVWEWRKLLEGPPRPAAEAAKAAQPRICPVCKGTGKVVVSKGGGVSLVHVCEYCKGTGKIAR